MWAYLLGSLIGVISGLIPGFHINNVALLLFNLYLSSHYCWIWMCIFGAIVTNTAFSYLAAIYFNVSDNDACFASTLSIKFAKYGLIKEYLLLAYLGLAKALVLIILFLPLLLKYHILLYRFLLPYFPFILLFIITVMLWKASKHEILIALSSSLLGIFAFHSSLNSNYVLLPVFFGMFGLPTYLLFNEEGKHKIVKNKKVKIKKTEIKRYWIAALYGLGVAYLSSLIPSTSPLLFFAPFAKYLKTPKEMVVSLASMNFSDALLSIISLPLTGNSRSGAGIMIQNIYVPQISQLPSLLIISALLLALYYKPYRILINRAYYFSKLKNALYLLLICYVIITTKIAGILILLNASLIGMYALKNKVSPSYLLFVIVMPTLLSIFITSF